MQNIAWGVLFFLSTIASHVGAQLREEQIDILSTRNGLRSNSIYGVFHDMRGFLWICSTQGIDRYDGKYIKNFPQLSDDPLLSHDPFYQTGFPLDSNTVVFFNYTGEAVLYDYRMGTFLRYKKHAHLASVQLNSGMKDSSGTIWIATNGGIAKFDATFSFLQYYPIQQQLHFTDENYSVNLIKKHPSGIFFLGTYSNGIITFDPRTEKFSPLLPNTIGAIQIHDFAFSHNGTVLWAASGGKGLIRIDVNSRRPQARFFQFSSLGIDIDEMLTLCLQNDSTLWTGTTEGLYKITIHPKLLEKFIYDPLRKQSISNNVIHTIYEANNVLWIGTENGLNRIVLTKPRFQKFSHSPSNPTSLLSNGTYQIETDSKGNLWVATNKGLSISKRQTQQFHHYKLGNFFSSNNNFLSSFTTTENALWIGTWGNGIFTAYLPDTFSVGDPISFTKVTESPPRKYASRLDYTKRMVVDTDNNVWIATWGGGVKKLSYKKKHRYTFSYFTTENSPALVSNYITDLAKDHDGNVWVASPYGLNRFNRQTQKFEKVFIDSLHPDSKMNHCEKFFKTADGSIYIGTQKGVAIIEISSRGEYAIRKIFENSLYFTYQIAVDEQAQEVWLATNQPYFLRYNIQRQTFTTFDLTSETDGFEFNFGYPYTDNKGTMYFCGSDGILLFQPQHFHTTTRPLPIVLSSISVSGEEYNSHRDISLISSLEVEHNRNDITLNFAFLNFQNAHRSNYFYELIGGSRRTVNLKNRSSVSFANLAPGMYTFNAWSADEEGRRNSDILSLAITVHPPFWKTAWFIGATAAVVMILSGFFVRKKVKSIGREQEQQQQFSRMLIESQEKERKRVASELHDNIGQNLLVIGNLLELMKKPSNASEVEKISEIVKESVHDVRQMSTHLHPPQFERIPLAKVIQSLIKKVQQAGALSFEIHIDEIDPLLNGEAKINIFRIVQECLNNVYKHAHATHVTINIRAEKNSIILQIADNGKGMQMSQREYGQSLEAGFGMRSIHERVKLLLGTLEIVSTPFQGTTITCIFPIIKINVDKKI